MAKRFTDSYVATLPFNPLEAEGAALTNIKERVALINAQTRALAHSMGFPAKFAPRLKVRVMGRLGKGNPHAHLCRKATSIPLAYSTRVDVYLNVEYHFRGVHSFSYPTSPEYEAEQKKHAQVYEALRTHIQGRRKEAVDNMPQA